MWCRQGSFPIPKNQYLVKDMRDWGEWYLLARRFPHLTIFWVCSSVQASRSADFTLDICVPIPLWIPEHRMQMKTPSDHDAHLGCVATWQSAQTRFSGRLSNSFKLASCDLKKRDTLRMAAFLSVVDCDCLNLFAIFRFFVLSQQIRVHTVPFLSLTIYGCLQASFV